MTKICSMPALLRHDRENKSQRENLQVKMLAVAGYHTVTCDAFIVLELTIFCSVGTD